MSTTRAGDATSDRVPQGAGSAFVVDVHKLAMADPADVSGLERLLEEGRIAPADIVATIGKTEGNGGANDFTRALATRAVADLLAYHLRTSRDEILARVALVWSGGCEGVLSPHMTVFARRAVGAAVAGPEIQGKTGRLAISVQRTRRIAAEEVGRAKEIAEVAAAVRRACDDLGVSGPDVHYVQVKGPLLTPSAIADARRRGVSLVTEDPNKSKAFARGATALGVAVGLGELCPTDVPDDMVTMDLGRFSAVASTSAGGELDSCEIVVLANAPSAGGNLRIGHAAMSSPVDLEGVREAFRSAGLDLKGDPDEDDRRRIVAVLAKADAPVGGLLNGWRTTMLSDADINYERHARAATGAVIASQTGDPRIFISGGTEHQLPPGHAPIAAIVDLGP
ncbi:MAG TPA: ring-opening amidohydrolase [Acidimicrobiales bacterium]|nr:ring-opening amidohydrolase [Acidimicrobiales bacterium]